MIFEVDVTPLHLFHGFHVGLALWMLHHVHWCDSPIERRYPHWLTATIVAMLPYHHHSMICIYEHRRFSRHHRQFHLYNLDFGITARIKWWRLVWCTHTLHYRVALYDCAGSVPIESTISSSPLYTCTPSRDLMFRMKTGKLSYRYHLISWRHFRISDDKPKKIPHTPFTVPWQHCTQ